MTPEPRQVVPDAPAKSPATADTSRSQRWAEVKAVFVSALSLDGAARESFLRERCGDDEELRREVDSLLLASEDTGDFMERPPVSLKSFVDVHLRDEDPSEPALGSRVGAYRLEEEVGRGGMGSVYLATRADSEFRKRVAI